MAEALDILRELTEATEGLARQYAAMGYPRGHYINVAEATAARVRAFLAAPQEAQEASPADFATRCRIAQECLPDAEYRRMLTALHADMLAALAQMEADARRYRWLRDNGCNIYGDTGPVPIPQNDGTYKNVDAPAIRCGDNLDAAIDSAISAEGASNAE